MKLKKKFTPEELNKLAHEAVQLGFPRITHHHKRFYRNFLFHFTQLQKVASCQSHIFIELGLNTGRTTFAVARFLDKVYEDFLCIGIDFARTRGKHRMLRQWKQGTGKHYLNGKVIFLIEDTQLIGKMFEGVAAYIFLDACHCYECVKKDIAAWKNKIEIGGFFVLHDTGTECQGVTFQKSHAKKPAILNVIKAIKDSNLEENFKLVDELDIRGGLRCYQRIK